MMMIDPTANTPHRTRPLIASRMNAGVVRYETGLYLLALLLALGVRLFNLGAAPLSDYEAGWALQAWQVSGAVRVQPQFAEGAVQAGTVLELGPQPAYIFLTGASFALFGANNFLARFWPALVGALLVLVPYLFRHALGRNVALILAFGLALDPGLVASSRLAGGPSMALGFTLLALAAWFHAAGSDRKSLLAGVLGGLALLSGPSLIVGVLPLLCTWLLFRFAQPRQERSQEQDNSEAGAAEHQAPTPAALPGLRVALAAAALTVLLVGSGMFRYPQGLGAWASTLTTYLEGWVGMPSGVPAARLAVALLFYQPFAMIFALISVLAWLVSLSLGYSRENGNPPLLTIAWALFSLVLVMVYPGRQVIDLVWVLVPLWVLAALELGNYLRNIELNPIAFAQGGLLLLLAALFWNTLIATQHGLFFEGVSWSLVRVLVLVGIVLLAVLTTILVALGWSWESARAGLLWGMMAAFSIYTITAMWGATQLRHNQPQELWSPPPATLQADLMLSTLQDVSAWRTGFPEFVDLACTVDVPSMRWVLRDFPKVRFMDQPAFGDLPDVVITRQDQAAPSLAAAYRGQDFAWWAFPSWTGAAPPDFLEWLTFRQAPITTQQIILWARSDLFPEGALETEEQP